MLTGYNPTVQKGISRNSCFKGKSIRNPFPYELPALFSNAEKKSELNIDHLK
jgi:hypothetical protein